MAPCIDAHAVEHALPDEQVPRQEPQWQSAQPSPQADPQLRTPADLAHTTCRATSPELSEALGLSKVVGETVSTCGDVSARATLPDWLVGLSAVGIEFA